MKKELVKKILAELVSFKTESTKGTDYEECAKFIADSLSKIGFKTNIVSEKTPDGKIHPNVIAEKKGKKSDGAILYAAHFDVVPPGEGWDTDPWNLSERDGKLYGRGASDDKGAIAAFIAAMTYFTPEVTAKAVFVCDEEIGGQHGMGFVTKKVRSWFSDVEFVWLADSSAEFIANGSSGVLGGEVIVHGIGSHAGLPYKAKNPVHMLIDFLKELKEYEKIALEKKSHANAPPNCPYEKVPRRFSITILSAGHKTNIIPNVAKAGFDLRFLPDESSSKAKKDFEKFFNGVVEKTGIKAELNFLYGHDGYIQPLTEAVVQFRRFAEKHFDIKGFAACLGGNDAVYLAELGLTVIGFGPIEEDTRIHMPNEFIRIETLEKMISLIKDTFIIS